MEISGRSSVRRSPFWSGPVFHVTLVVVLGVLIYANTFQVPFLFDDEASIAQNHVIKNLHDFVLEGSGYRYNARRFIGYLTLALNYHFGGLNVAGYHLFNLGVHIITALLVYLLARLTLRTPFFAGREERGELEPGLPIRALVPLFVALLFVCHPVQTQAVTYIVQRLASLATLFFVLSLVCYIKGRLCVESTGRVLQLRSVAWYAFALLSAAAAMRTKEISFTLPFIVALFEFSFFRNTLRKKIIFLFPVVLSLVIVPLTLLGTGKPIDQIMSQIAQSTRLQTDMPRLDYLFTQFRVIVTYLRLLIFPVNQNLDYDYPIYRSFFTAPVFLSFLLLLSLFLLAIYLLYRSKTALHHPGAGTGEQGATDVGAVGEDAAGEGTTSEGAAGAGPLPLPELRLISFGILWFFVTLSIESSFIPIVDVIYEHRLYLPSVGAFLALATLAAILLRNARPRAVFWGVGSVVLVLGSATLARNAVWGDAVTLAEDIARKSPAVARAHYNLALALDDAGRSDDALREAAIAAKLDREDARPWNLIGRIVAKQGRYDDAIAAFSLALDLYPDASYTHLNLGNVYMSKGMTDRAMEHLLIASRLDPKNPEIYNKIGKAYSFSSNAKEAISFFERAVALDPSRPEYRFNLQKEKEAAFLTDSWQKPTR